MSRSNEEIECVGCEWKGKHTDLIDIEYCPVCNCRDFVELDGVSSDDYLQQQSGDREVIE